MTDHQPSPSPEPDIVYAIQPSPDFVYAQSGTCFKACTSGLYRTTDGGLTWHSAYTSLNLNAPLTTTALALSPDFRQDQTLFAGSPGGILRSFDGGDTWHGTMLLPPPPNIIALVISPNYAEDGILLAGTLEDGVFRSADRGVHWIAWNFGLLDLNLTCLAISPQFAQDETLYAGTESGLFRSTNGGRAWREVDLPMGFTTVLSLAITSNSDQDCSKETTNIYLGTEEQGLWTSQDSGKSWLRLGEKDIQAAVNSLILDQNMAHQPRILVQLDETLLISRDGGLSWTSWLAEFQFEQGIASLAASQGLREGAKLLVGDLAGQLKQV